MIGQIRERLARIDALNGRIHEGAEFTRLLNAKAFHARDGGAYVLPAGLRGGQPQAATGAFVQPLDEVISVVLVRPSEDQRGARAMAEIAELIEEVLGVLAGWRPDGALGPLRVNSGRMVNVGAGVMLYLLEFSVARQLRISPV